MRALYDLGWRLPSFNFFEWLVQAKTLGAETVVFDIRNMRSKKWPENITERRFRSICLPGPALAGLPVEVIDGRTAGPANAIDPVSGAGGGAIVKFWKERRYIERLRVPEGVEHSERPRYTVTLRNTERSPRRNSDMTVWREFAAHIGARVIPDYDDEPLHLHKRMAMYATAEMNFFVSNGPGVLCTFTDYPCMIFCMHHAAGSLEADGIHGWGARYPWMLPNQHAVWEDATDESLRAHFYYWKRTGEFLERLGSPTET